MEHTTRALAFAAVAGLLLALPASAQTLEEICPDAEEGTGVLWGAVLDADGEMLLPGANVFVTWTAGGQEQTAQVQAGLDGGYRMCHVPLETTVWAHASFSSTAGEAVEVMMTEVFTRRDLSLAMTAGGGPDDRLWVCVYGGQSEFNMRFSRLFRCDENWQPLERCPKTELGKLTVQPVGAGSGMLREMAEQLALEARRLGANAVVNLRDGRGSTSFIGTEHSNVITGEAVLIEVDPSTCK